MAFLHSLLSQCAPSRWNDFLNITNDQVQTERGQENDLFVGENKRVTLTLANGSTRVYRDIVVLGELIIKASNPSDPSTKPCLIARDFFNAGRAEMSHINYTGRDTALYKDSDAFRNELKSLLFLEMLSFQRESARKIGLKSILV